MKGLVTGIGSLPYTEAEAAVDTVLARFPEIPFWPQLPRRDIREGMVAQFSEQLPCLRLLPSGLVFAGEGQEESLERFYEKVIAEDTDYFKVSPEYARGLYALSRRLQAAGAAGFDYIKCHSVGPFTFSAAVNDEQGVALLHNEVFRQAFSKGLALKARWQIEHFRSFGKKIIFFLDEPYLGCFGSAYTPINREDVVSGLGEFCASIRSDDVSIGVHCCGNTDWSILTQIDSVDIISFDAFSYLERLILYSADLKKFFKRGGVLCWGIVPTQEFTGSQTAGELVGKIRQGIEALAKKGLDREQVARQLLLSPSCGLGSLDVKQAEGVLGLLRDTAEAFHSGRL